MCVCVYVCKHSRWSFYNTLDFRCLVQRIDSARHCPLFSSCTRNLFVALHTNNNKSNHDKIITTTTTNNNNRWKGSVHWPVMYGLVLESSASWRNSRLSYFALIHWSRQILRTHKHTHAHRGNDHPLSCSMQRHMVWNWCRAAARTLVTGACGHQTWGEVLWKVFWYFTSICKFVMGGYEYKFTMGTRRSTSTLVLYLSTMEVHIWLVLRLNVVYIEHL